ncbi:hypothetical protein Tco_1175886 [Tanacetum coccineum]
MDKEIVLENQNKELENILCKLYRSTQAIHMLTKSQVFYDNTHKQALCYQNPFYLKKAQRIKPTLYDGSIIAKELDVIFMIDDEETLILEEESRSKMLDKQNDPISIKHKINISPIDYSKLNKLKEDFSKRFVTKKELFGEQAFCFDKVVKKRTTSDAITTDEITKVQTVFNQIEAVVDQCSVDKNAFEIQIKQLSIDNDQLLKQIMFQESVHIAVNSVDILNVNKSCVDECNKCLELETKLLKKKDLIEKDDNFRENENAPTFNQLFEINELKAQSQEKDTVIRKLKDRIKSLNGKDSVENVKKDIDETETINIELEHTLKNELRKLKGKNIFDTAVSKPSATIAQEFADNVDDDDVVGEDGVVEIVYGYDVWCGCGETDVSGGACLFMAAGGVAGSLVGKGGGAGNFNGREVLIASQWNEKIDNNTTRFDHLNVVDSNAYQGDDDDVVGEDGVVEMVYGDDEGDGGSEVLDVVVVRGCLWQLEEWPEKGGGARNFNGREVTCPSLTKPCEKLVAVTLINKDKKVRFVELITSSSNIPNETDSLRTKDSNKPLLTSTGVNIVPSASGSKPLGN